MSTATFIPPRRLAAPRSSAERRVLEWLGRLPEGWTVIHSLGITNHPFKRWAEADVVLVGPDGLLVLEVKGGRVARHEGVWEFTDHAGRVTRRNEGPFDQAGGAHGAIRRSLIDSGALGRDQCSGYAVLLPDCALRSPPDGLGAVLLDANHRWGDPQRIVSRWCRYWGERTKQDLALTTADRRRVVDVLRGDLDLRPVLGLTVEGVSQELSRLTAQQDRVMRAASANDRIVVSGRAGTGKTMLALHEAERLAADGYVVLLTCQSRVLARRLASAVGRASRVTVSVFDDVAPRPGQIWTSTFDVAIIDEAQDIPHEILIATLDARLKGGTTDGRWRVLLDPAQDLFAGDHPEKHQLLTESASAVLELSLNCRNTRQIAVAASMLARVELDVEAPATGPAVRILWWSNPREHDEALAAELSSLCTEVPSDQVVVLTRTPLDLNRAQAIGESAGIPLEPIGSPPARSIATATVDEFKGLEAGIVVLADVADLDRQALRRHAYVGCTRARALLIVLLHEELREDYQLGAEWFGGVVAARQSGRGQERGS